MGRVEQSLIDDLLSDEFGEFYAYDEADIEVPSWRVVEMLRDDVTIVEQDDEEQVWFLSNGVTVCKEL